MKKALTLIAFMLFSLVSHAQTGCATNITELKALVGNPGISMNWRETIKNDPLGLKLSNGGPGQLRLKLSNAKGEWADVTGIICKKGNDYEARVSNIVWGPGAPSIVKGKKLSTLAIKLPYDTLMKVSIRMLISFSFEFAAI